MSQINYSLSKNHKYFVAWLLCVMRSVCFIKYCNQQAIKIRGPARGRNLNTELPESIHEYEKTGYIGEGNIMMYVCTGGRARNMENKN
jgi:hypothetical protein